MQIKIPSYITLAINMLKERGYEAYIVGGCVRDALLGKEPNDWDICTSALPEHTAEVFKDFKLVTAGIKHGTVCVIINHSPVEITTFRVDGEYKDNRRPESITFTPSLEDDLKRRDFTINAMAYSDEKGIIDLLGGMCDLQNKVIRCVGNPETRFDEDALRIMRALRFSSQLGFDIDKKTKDAIFAKKDLLKNISAERITDEFTKLILADNYCKVLKEYEKVINVFLPNFNVEFFDAVTDSDIRLRLAQVLSSSKCNIDDAFSVLKLPKAIKMQVTAVLKNSFLEIHADKYAIKKLLAVLGTELFSLILSFKTCFGENMQKQHDIFKGIIDNNECYSIKQLDISGSDIINLGIGNHQNVGKILDYLLELVISDKIKNNRKLLLAAATEYIKTELSQ